MVNKYWYILSSNTIQIHKNLRKKISLNTIERNELICTRNKVNCEKKHFSEQQSNGNLNKLLNWNQEKKIYESFWKNTTI